jgi:hypothetical protein
MDGGALQCVGCGGVGFGVGVDTGAVGVGTGGLGVGRGGCSGETVALGVGVGVGFTPIALYGMLTKMKKIPPRTAIRMTCRTGGKMLIIVLGKL